MQNNSITQKERLMMAKDIYCAVNSTIEQGCTATGAFMIADELIQTGGFITEGQQEPEFHSMD